MGASCGQEEVHTVSFLPRQKGCWQEELGGGRTASWHSREASKEEGNITVGNVRTTNNKSGILSGMKGNYRSGMQFWIVPEQLHDPVWKSASDIEFIDRLQEGL